MAGLTVTFGLLAIIFLVAALASGVVERAPISFPMIFLGLGFLVGDHGLGWIQVGLKDPTLETIATLSLAFVLFLDALNLRFAEDRSKMLIPLLALGPGTILTTLLMAGTAALLLHFSLIQALLLGAVLSSVDPVLLRDVESDERIPRSVRESLKTEAGANDLIVLPILLVLEAVALNQSESVGGWALFLAKLFLVGPIAGFAVGAAATWLMVWMRQRTTINREYRALYGIGVLLASYYAGSSLGGSGFLAVFAAGVATTWLDYDLCDCFLEYGEITAEMAMLLAFLLFGALLSSVVGLVALLPALIFALIALVVVRPVAINAVLYRARISRHARLFIGWFGPRGLSSLLFGLLLVSAGVPGSEIILATAGVVVIVSVILHGVSAAPLAAQYSRLVARKTLPEEREATAEGLFLNNPANIPRITPAELAERLASPSPPVVLDVRSRSTYDRAPGQIPGAVRVLPDQVAVWAEEQPKDREVITYCT